MGNPSAAPHPPQQARSRRTLQSLEDAGFALIAERGPEGVTVADVVARADSSVGSFYARFPGKDEFFLHLQARLRERALERWLEVGIAGATDPIMETVRFVVDDEVTGGAQRRALSPGGVVEPGADALSARITSDLAEALGGDGEAGRPPEASVDLAVRLVRATVAAVLPGASGTAADGGAGVEAARLTRVLIRVVRGMVGAHAPGTADSPDPDPDGADRTDPAPHALVDPFEIWA